MKTNFLGFVYFCLIIQSCRSTDESNRVLSEATNVYYFSDLSDSIKIDSSMSLTNLALELDDKNLNAYQHKSTLLTRTRDIKELIKVAEQLIQLRPNKPYLYGQKAIYLEIAGDSAQAIEYYQMAISKFKKALKTNDSNDFNILIEYVDILQFSGDTLEANMCLKRMESMEQGELQKAYFALQGDMSLIKKQVRRYWSGEIEYDQIAKLP